MIVPRTYLDHNATAPLRVEARAAMLDALDLTGNPSSVHADGRRVRAIVERAREQVAALVGAAPADVVFTSGATEANAWVMSGGWDTIFVAGHEHASVLEPARRSGAHVVSIPVASDGVARAEVIADHILRGPRNYGRALISLQLANSETGVLQPVQETSAFATAHGVLTHTDAVQAMGRMPVSIDDLGGDYLSLTAHKFGGPKGIGALVLRNGAPLRCLIAGGGQERSRRAGTENVAAIAGFGAAAVAVMAEVGVVARMCQLRDMLEAQVLQRTPAAVVIGAGAERLCNTSCIALPGLKAETLVIKFDLAGVSLSAGAACSSGKVGESHVLAAMGLPRVVAQSAIRISLGPTTTEQDIASCLAAWTHVTAGAALAA
jgi:cysteine desulfurase